MIKTTFPRQHHRSILLILVMILLAFALQPMPKVQANQPAPAVQAVDGGLLQYTSQGHVLGFRSGEMVVSNGTYALKVSFEGANAVAPTSDSAAQSGQVLALGRVTYANLWDGVTLAYQQSAGGIFESTYRVESQFDVSAIRLRYNAPVTLNSDGTLTSTFETGQVTESAPVAWQEVNGQRQPVEIVFIQLSEHEVSFAAGDYDASQPLFIDPTFLWNTFLGGSGDDSGDSIAVDGSGNVFIAGYSTAAWGCSPTSCTIRAYRSNKDAFVAKLDSNGELIWNTFLGDTGNDFPYSITVDANGLYVTGNSNATWGSPIRAYGGAADSFVAKLDLDGKLAWNTFLGGGGNDAGQSIEVDTNGIYIAGESSAAWGSPIRGYTASFDAFVAKLDSNGNLTWNTFLGGGGNDAGNSIEVDTNGIYIAGESSAAWGCSPTTCTIREYTTSSFDAFVAKLDLDGNLTWNTFLGGSGDDRGYSIAMDGSGMYITGKSNATWGSPIYAYTASFDVFVVRLNSSGNLLWNAFLGGNGIDIGYSIALNGNLIYIAGNSTATWGSPVRAYTAGQDAFVKKFSGLCTISGNAGVAGAKLRYTDGTAKTATSSANGAYSFTVSDGWTGSVTPTKAGHVFSPLKKNYSNVIANKPAQNYSAYAPAGTVAVIKPTYKWTKIAGATQYQYQVMQGTKIVYSATVASSVCGVVTCSSKPTKPLVMGTTYKWQVKKVGGNWSPFVTFVIKPKAGSWNCLLSYCQHQTDLTFSITADQSQVSNFTAVFYSDACPTVTLTHDGLITIDNTNTFSFTDDNGFHAEGKFSTPTMTAVGKIGYKDCNNRPINPYDWKAEWKNVTRGLLPGSGLEVSISDLILFKLDLSSFLTFDHAHKW